MNPLTYDTCTDQEKASILVAFAYQVKTQKSGAELKRLIQYQDLKIYAPYIATNFQEIQISAENKTAKE